MPRIRRIGNWLQHGWHLDDTGCWHYCGMRFDNLARPVMPYWLQRFCDATEGRQRVAAPRLRAWTMGVRPRAGESVCIGCVRELVAQTSRSADEIAG